MKTLETLASEALLLPVEQRLSLAHQLLASVDDEEDSEFDKAWEAEIQRRISDYDSGKVKGIPADQVFAELDRRLAKKK